jgi:hypothetical protein
MPRALPPGRHPGGPREGCFVDEDVNHPNGIILANPVFQAFGKQRALPPVRPLNETPHPIPRKQPGNHIARFASSSTFSHSQGQKPPYQLRSG